MGRLTDIRLMGVIEHLSCRGVPGDDIGDEMANDIYDALIELHAYRSAAPLEQVLEWAKAAKEGRMGKGSCNLTEEAPDYLNGHPSDRWCCGNCGENIDDYIYESAEDSSALGMHCVFCGWKFEGIKYHEDDALFIDEDEGVPEGGETDVP